MFFAFVFKALVFPYNNDTQHFHTLLCDRCHAAQLTGHIPFNIDYNTGGYTCGLHCRKQTLSHFGKRYFPKLEYE